MSVEKEIKKNYRDSLFRHIFGNPEYKEWTLSLYNAVNGSNYTDVDALEINTLEDVVYMKIKNDVSFIVDNVMNLYEQQSTFNPNMPMRFLIYASKLYGKRMQTIESYDIYGTTLQKFPASRFVCFYNGPDNKDDVAYLKLSSAFGEDYDPNIELKSGVEVVVIMFNINYGRNKKLLEACRPLHDYSLLVSHMVENQKVKKLDPGAAFDAALDALPDDSPIKKILLAQRAEVRDMCITEFNQQRHDANLLAEGEARGRAEGKAEGVLEEKKSTAAKLAQKGWTIQEIAEFLEVDVVDVEIWLADE